MEEQNNKQRKNHWAKSKVDEATKKTIEILMSSDLEFQYRSLMVIKQIMEVEIWTDIRFLMINKAITLGEITELIRRQAEIDKDIERWGESIQKAIFARG